MKKDDYPVNFDLSDEASSLADSKVPHSKGNHRRFPQDNLQVYGKAGDLKYSAMRKRENGEDDEPVDLYGDGLDISDAGIYADKDFPKL